MKLDTFIERHIKSMQEREKIIVSDSYGLQSKLEAVRNERSILETEFQKWRGETKETDE